MKISILTPDISSNGLGRAYILAKMLQPLYKVEIVGPMFGDGIWSPVESDKTVEYRFIKLGKMRPYFLCLGLLGKIDGDVIYASKPVFTSFGLGLLKKMFSKKKLVLDIDDWEFGFKKDEIRNKSIYQLILFWTYSIVLFYRHGSYFNVLLHEKLVRFADSKTVSNAFLQNKFGGKIIHHARDTQKFNPINFDKSELRRKYNIAKNKKIVMFVGSPKPHKGLDDLVSAVHSLSNENVVLVVVGMNHRSKYCASFAKKAQKILKKQFIQFGFQPFERIPEFLAIADVIVIPQKAGDFSAGQMPAKVFDAMAMSKPIIATNVGSLAQILDDCGIIIPPGNIEELRKAINWLLTNETDSQIMGSKARQKCIQHYSLDAVGENLREVF